MTAPATGATPAAHRPAPRGIAPGRSSARRPAWRAGALAVAAALMLHAVLLGVLPEGVSPDPAADAARGGTTLPVSVRQIAWVRPKQEPESPVVAPKNTAAPAPAKPDSAARRASPAAPPPEPRENVELPAPVPPAAASSPEWPTQEPSASAALSSSTAAPVAPAESDTASAAAPDLGSASSVPVYRTQPAPPATLQFELKRGLASGQAVLQWRPDIGSASYGLSLQAQVLGVSVAGWNSSGRFDAAGLAPDRYAESRRSREVRATNFQRVTQKISFSAQSTEFELTPGVQDRSSWMLQLGAVLQANPELAQPGAQVTLIVVGTRGAPEPWVFTVVDRAALVLNAADAPSTVADAVQLLREPRRPYDTRVRVWLDRARHHLPVKVQMLVQATGEGQEFELRQLTLP